ncbi:uncharacterized protein J4E78_004824 [Alternaria triticimaculans]|uniref:uncharacterized protein n=1 Tax=Alternaria triticimaculans TaxID=297637 RepID=UPI0020C233AB|nr:uncharacterized protein J4E78_004824 [Alternaria triticimaculans]KAI4662033.1 hypothetical protein J4E78_004824 [Alternaria triticimaculans]
MSPLRRTKRPPVKMAAKPICHLLHMPLAILLLVLEDVYETDREAFFNFRLVSKASRNESQYLFFRNFTLHDRTLLGPSLSSPMLERLRDRNGKTGEYVRHLEIGPFKDEDKFKLEILPLLERILRSVSNLQDLTWRVNCELPPALLSLFSELHPSAHLHWILKNRRFRPLDHSLLSSPQLYTLDAEIYATMPEQTGHSLSELAYIKNTVPASLQVLRLSTIDVDGSVQRAQFDTWGYVKCGMFYFDFEPGDQFPALLELALRQGDFALTEQSCNLWACATSWERLERLDLPNGTSPQFIASLTNRAINLKYLRFHISTMNFMIRRQYRPYSGGNWLNAGVGTMSIMTRFLASIKSLHTLDFAYEDSETLMSYLRFMLQSLHGSLRSLTISDMGGYYHFPMDPLPSGKPYWDPGQYREVLELAPGLEHFDARIGTRDSVVGDWEGKGRYADVEKKWRTAKKTITAPPRVKIQRAKRALKLIV